MYAREEFKSSDKLIIGNGQGLPITHIGDACFSYKGFNSVYNHTHSTQIYFVSPYSIIKNLLSISKLTVDNNLSIDFVGNVCNVKGSLKKGVLLKGLIEKELYKLLLNSSQSSQSSPSSFLCHTNLNKPLPMLFTCCLNFLIPIVVRIMMQALKLVIGMLFLHVISLLMTLLFFIEILVIHILKLYCIY